MPLSDKNQQLDDTLQSKDISWGEDWHIYPSGYWEDVDERFFGEDTPNQPPKFKVKEKLAAEIHIIEGDIGLIQEVAKFWFPEETERFTKVVKIIFNDFSVVHFPLPPVDKDYENMRSHIVKNYVRDVIKWEAILEGRNPEPELREWDKWVSGEDIEEPEWYSDVEDTGLSDENREWLNDNAEWISYISKKVESENDLDIELEEDDSWEDDW